MPTTYRKEMVAGGRIELPTSGSHEFLDFMNEVVADYPHREIHVILDNLSTHKPKRDRWWARHPNVHWHYTPTHASWLNQIEIWFSILTRQALRGGSFTSPRQVREAIDRSPGGLQRPGRSVRMAETSGAWRWTQTILR